MNLNASHTAVRLVLASRSTRRRELLAEAGYTFELAPPAEVDEAPHGPDEDPYLLVARLAYAKAEAVAARVPSGVVVGCDTVAVCQDQILGKPLDEADARRMLRLLRGRLHDVLSGLCLWPRPVGRPVVRVAQTRLAMDPISDASLDDYLQSGAWQGKAGAFGLQDRSGWIHLHDGSESNVVGLPLELLADMLSHLPNAALPK